jgi:hypothetical protein
VKDVRLYGDKTEYAWLKVESGSRELSICWDGDVRIFDPKGGDQDGPRIQDPMDLLNALADFLGYEVTRKDEPDSEVEDFLNNHGQGEADDPGGPAELPAHLSEPVKEQPQFEHDCKNCSFLGQFNESIPGRGDRFDLYVCPGKVCTTVLARYGDRGQDYYSWDLNCPSQNAAIDECSRRAQRYLAAAAGR